MYNFSNKKPGNSRKLFDYNELLKNTVEQAAKKARQAADKSVSVSEPSWMSKGTKSSSPFANGNISSDNFTGLLSSDSSASLKKNENKKAQSSGSLIKQRLSKLLSDSTGKDYSKAFDGIDDSLVEKNIPLADDTVQKNTSKRAYYGDYPNMRDGMALFYAASEANDPKTAKLAREAAYIEDKSGKAKNTRNPLLNEDSKIPFPSFSLVDRYGKESQKTKAGDHTRYVVGNGVRLRTQPGTSSEILTSMDFGTSVKYTGNKTDMINGYHWAEVEYNGKKGWVADTLLGINDPVEAAKKQAELERQILERTRYVGKDGISLRSDPHTRSENIEVLKRGDTVEFTGEKIESLNRQWAKIIHNGNIGWVEANDLRMINPSVDPNTPYSLLVNKQSMDALTRSIYLDENIPKWIINDVIYDKYGNIRTDLDDEKQLIAQWYMSNKSAKIRYTGSYCLPVKPNRINQGFYGLTSHAGINGHSTGFLGAIDFKASLGDPVYSVLPGKVVYKPKDIPDFHRITVETVINGEIYYLEYLHLKDMTVEEGQTISMGTQIGTVGRWGRTANNQFPPHLDFRVYQFKDDNNKNYPLESSKVFIDPLELFDFDNQFIYDTGKHDYH